MFSHLRLGIVAAVCAFLIASAVPADAQRRNGSGSGQRGGASAAPRSSQGPGPSAAPRQGPGPSAGAPAPQNAGRGRAYPGGGPGYRPGGPGPGNRPGGPAPGYRPSYGPGYRPGYGPGYRPFYGYRGYYPWYGYGGYYPWYGYRGYSPSLYFGVGTWGWPYYYGSWPYAAYGYSEGSGYGAGSGEAGLKIEFKPKSAEVYVDGRLAGIVDQFDGMFDSLSLEAGEHEITIYQEGFRSTRQRLNLSEGSTLRMKGALEPLAPGEPNEPRPQAAAQQGWTEPQVQMAPQVPRARAAVSRCATAVPRFAAAGRAARAPGARVESPADRELPVRAGGHSCPAGRRRGVHQRRVVAQHGRRRTSAGLPLTGHAPCRDPQGRLRRLRHRRRDQARRSHAPQRQPREVLRECAHDFSSVASSR